MGAMPYALVRKLKKFNRLILEAQAVDEEIQQHLEDVGVPYEHLVACVEPFERDAPVTEALAYINNGECVSKEELADSIRQIDEIYAYFLKHPVKEEE